MVHRIYCYCFGAVWRFRHFYFHVGRISHLEFVLLAVYVFIHTRVRALRLCGWRRVVARRMRGALEPSPRSLLTSYSWFSSRSAVLARRSCAADVCRSAPTPIIIIAIAWLKLVQRKFFYAFSVLEWSERSHVPGGEWFSASFRLKLLVRRCARR